MTLEMRELKGDDLFTLLAIVGKMDIKDEFMTLFQNNVESGSVANVVPLDHKKKQPTKAELAKQEADKAKQEAEAERRGMEAMAGMLQKVLLNAGKLKGDINALLADLTGETLATVQNLSLKDYTGLIIAFFKKPELADFFLSIASFLQPENSN
jgi:hypothetical protein